MPSLNIKPGYRELLAKATARIRTLHLNDAAAQFESAMALFIDLRESDERERHGWIPGAVHVPRGELEFYVDPTCPLHEPRLNDPRPFILYCAGGWRSALAACTLVDLGVTDVSHIDGGFGAWASAGLPVERAPR